MRATFLAVVIAMVAAFCAPSMISADPPKPVLHDDPQSMNDPYHVRGRVDSFDGKFNAVVHGMRVRLHQGTIIHPTGATITPGQYVIVRGHWTAHHFAADEIRIHP